MINVIKTAIITILISFASGLMLNYFTNLAPKILCNVRDAIPLKLDSKKIWAYIITVCNTSNKTIHELTLNIQSSQSNLKSTDEVITKGLKFDSSIKDNTLDVYIPFLSKGDKFSVTVYVDNQYAVHSKPVIAIRSPENFKEIDSVKRKGIIALLFDIPENINHVILKIMKKPDSTLVMNKTAGAQKTINKENRQVLHTINKTSKYKKAMIIFVSISLVIIAGGLGKFYFKGTSVNAPTSALKTTVTKQSTGVAGSAGRTTGDTSTRGAKVESTGRTVSKKVNQAATGTANTTGSKVGTTGTASVAGSKVGTTAAGSVAGSKTGTTGTAAGTTGSKTGTTGTTDTTGSKTATNGTADTAGSKTGTNGTVGSSGSNSTTSATGN